MISVDDFLRYAIRRDSDHWDWFCCGGCSASWSNRRQETGLDSLNPDVFRLAFEKMHHVLGCPVKNIVARAS